MFPRSPLHAWLPAPAGLGVSGYGQQKLVSSCTGGAAARALVLRCPALQCLAAAPDHLLRHLAHCLVCQPAGECDRGDHRPRSLQHPGAQGPPGNPPPPARTHAVKCILPLVKGIPPWSKAFTTASPCCMASIHLTLPAAWHGARVACQSMPQSGMHRERRTISRLPLPLSHRWCLQRLFPRQAPAPCSPWWAQATRSPPGESSARHTAAVRILG